MMTRSHSKTVVFSHPFELKGAAGRCRLETIKS